MHAICLLIKCNVQPFNGQLKVNIAAQTADSYYWRAVLPHMTLEVVFVLCEHFKYRYIFTLNLKSTQFLHLH